MGQQTIKFSIKQDGTVIEEVAGVVGTDCQNLTRTIEEKLGTVIKVQHKPEYYQSVILDEDETVEEFTHDSEGC